MTRELQAHVIAVCALNGLCIYGTISELRKSSWTIFKSDWGVAAAFAFASLLAMTVIDAFTHVMSDTVGSGLAPYLACIWMTAAGFGSVAPTRWRKVALIAIGVTAGLFLLGSGPLSRSY